MVLAFSIKEDVLTGTEKGGSAQPPGKEHKGMRRRSINWASVVATALIVPPYVIALVLIATRGF